MAVEAKFVSVKVNNLRKIYGNSIDLEKWIENSDNIYTGRRGKIFILSSTTNGSDKRVFYYPESRWANPYRNNGTLRKYVEHLFDTYTIFHIKELQGKTLGCFCDTSNQQLGNCHAVILTRLVNEFIPYIEAWCMSKDDKYKMYIITSLGL